MVPHGISGVGEASLAANKSDLVANKSDPKALRDNPAAVAEYLNKAFAKNDLQTILRALKFVMRAQNVKALAEVTGMARETLYRSFSGEAYPPFDRVLGLLAGLGVGLVAQPLPKRTKPLMAKKRSRKSWLAITATTGGTVQRTSVRSQSDPKAPAR